MSQITIVGGATAEPRVRPGRLHRRLVTFLAVFAVVLVAIAGRVAWMQTGEASDYTSYGIRQRTHTVVLPASRGTIFDRNGVELSISVPQTTIWADPRLMTNPDQVLIGLAPILGLDAARMTYLADQFSSGSEFVYIKRQVDDEIAQQVRDLELKGVYLLTEPRRFAPAGESGRSIIGATDLDGKGTAGLELQFDDVLSGTPGELVRERDRNGNSIPNGSHHLQAPTPGQDLVLTVDRRLQYTVEQKLQEQVLATKARGGMVVVLDSRSGDVLAMASVRRETSGGDVVVTSANLAAVDTYEPGSVAKIIAASGALEEGSADLTKKWEIPSTLKVYDAVINDDEPHGALSLTLPQIIAQSSNIGTVLLARSIGTEKLESYLRAFGFGNDSGLGFPGEADGLLPPSSRWSGTQKATIAYGQGIGVTAIQLAAAMNTIANDGVYVTPRLVRSTVDQAGIEQPAPASVTRQAIRPETARSMNEVLRGVVCFGTARTTAKIPGYQVAGKTGTAWKAQPSYPGQKDGYVDRTGQRHYYASFMGFVPADDPQVTVLVSIDEPDASSDLRYGRTAAAPLFTEVASEALRALKVPPRIEGSGCPPKT